MTLSFLRSAKIAPIMQLFVLIYNSSLYTALLLVSLRFFFDYSQPNDLNTFTIRFIQCIFFASPLFFGIVTVYHQLMKVPPTPLSSQHHLNNIQTSRDDNITESLLEHPIMKGINVQNVVSPQIAWRDGFSHEQRDTLSRIEDYENNRCISLLNHFKLTHLRKSDFGLHLNSRVLKMTLFAWICTTIIGVTSFLPSHYFSSTCSNSNSFSSFFFFDSKAPNNCGVSQYMKNMAISATTGVLWDDYPLIHESFIIDMSTRGLSSGNTKLNDIIEDKDISNTVLFTEQITNTDTNTNTKSNTNTNTKSKSHVYDSYQASPTVLSQGLTTSSDWLTSSNVSWLFLSLFEELAWSVIALPLALRATKYRIISASLLIAFIWFSWHASYVLLYNYLPPGTGYSPGSPLTPYWYSIPMLFVVLGLMRVFFSFLSVLSGSIIPSVIAHATHNSLIMGVNKYNLLNINPTDLINPKFCKFFPCISADSTLNRTNQFLLGEIGFFVVFAYIILTSLVIYMNRKLLDPQYLFSYLNLYSEDSSLQFLCSYVDSTESKEIHTYQVLRNGYLLSIGGTSLIQQHPSLFTSSNSSDNNMDDFSHSEHTGLITNINRTVARNTGNFNPSNISLDGEIIKVKMSLV